MKGTPEYMARTKMIMRCENPKDPKFPSYGGRGITVCRAWRESFAAFFRDMGPRPSASHSLDRVDNDGNYEPSNCRWATKTEQSRNRSNARLLTHDGATLGLAEWAEVTGITETAIRTRIDRKGWSVADALTRPLRRVKTGAARRAHARG